MWKIHHVDLHPGCTTRGKKSPYVRSYLKREVLLQNAATGGRDEALLRGRHMTHVRETISCAIYHMGLPPGNHYLYRAPSPSIPADLKGHATRVLGLASNSSTKFDCRRLLKGKMHPGLLV